MLQALPIAAVPSAPLANSPIPGFGIEDITWEIQTTPGGPTVNVTGTIQQVIQFAEKKNPEFRSAFGLDAPVDLKSASNDGECGGILHPCGDDKVESVECSYDGDKAVFGAFTSIIDDLANLPGNPLYCPGPRFCMPLGCKEMSAVWWCNLGHAIFDQNSYRELSLAAWELMSCPDKVNGWVQGQVTMKDNWSIVVRGENC